VRGNYGLRAKNAPPDSTRDIIVSERLCLKPCRRKSIVRNANKPNRRRSLGSIRVILTEGIGFVGNVNEIGNFARRLALVWGNTEKC